MGSFDFFEWFIPRAIFWGLTFGMFYLSYCMMKMCNKDDEK